MKTVRRVVAVLLFVAPMFVPVRSKAEGFSDFLHSLFHDEQRRDVNDRRMDWQRPPDPRDPRAQQGAAGNAVPLDGGLVFLLAAGLGLGIGMVYSRNKRVAEVEPA